MAKTPWSIRDAIKAELQPDEIIRWTGRPTFMPMLMSQSIQIVFGIVFAGMTIQPALSVLNAIIYAQPQKDPVTSFIALVFSVVGFFFVATALLEVIETTRTAYAVTNRRILIVSDLLRKRVLAFAPTSINAVETRYQSNGYGTVVFRREVVKGAEGDGILKLAFVGTADVANAAREIEKLRLSAQPNTNA